MVFFFVKPTEVDCARAPFPRRPMNRDGCTPYRSKVASGFWIFRRFDGWLGLVILASLLRHGASLVD
jgi:hypothetical protein